MTTDNSLNEFPPLSEEVERMLRLQAWKDETFRQELIANPKGVTERLFPECFPDGKVPEQITYKVIEEDQYSPHIILPALHDEFLAPEIPKSAFISSFLY
jgi:hypothetical protein